MKTPTKDLFDDSTMSFGEHLEALRTHLIRALLGTVLAALVCLWQGDALVTFVRRPIDRALQQYATAEILKETQQQEESLNVVSQRWQQFWAWLSGKEVPPEAVAPPPVPIETEVIRDTITVHLAPADLARALHDADPDRYPAPSPAPTAETKPAKDLAIRLRAPEFAQFQATVEQSRRPVTLNVQEAFMVYLKVSLVAAAVISSPWVFYQLWLFVAAGLYPHERKYVYLYGTMSLVLFLSGAAFCFFAVFPLVLEYLLSFNAMLQLHPQIRLSEWISFAVFLPLMFGIGFQLPLVMIFLDRIGVFSVQQFREQWRLAVLIIAIVAVILTPSDPTSMLAMFIPLVGLYFFGIWLCTALPRMQPIGSLD